ncbi:metal-binding protein [Sneathiella sp. P13V-1]|uniref:Ada metal-binding domain-containing protein n=1 Tax=Sneathiella sp. P13V-1 TaxID=2697366 RepID=UPI00187B5A1A|nr:Ada metal-binding domain-containing protein [Sneathiella sp. P13V-1]MBE7635467.1 metal-binding protein [Sneathiella sp. P13V-1]
MMRHLEIQDAAFKAYIKAGDIQWGGHRKLKIYGRLDCWSGKKMKRENRVFFKSKEEAQSSGFRPCGHCMKKAYRQWISLNR